MCAHKVWKGTRIVLFHTFLLRSRAKKLVQTTVAGVVATWTAGGHLEPVVSPHFFWLPASG